MFQLCEEVLTLKVELQTIATQFKKKSALLKGGMLTTYETKSNNLTVLREETQQALHAIVGKVDQVHQLLVQARGAFTVREELSEPKRYVFNV